MSQWTHNSYTPENMGLSGIDFENLSIATIALCLAILIHSFYINGLRLTTVRVCTDLACSTTIGLLACMLRCTRGCTHMEFNIYVNILANGLFSGVVQGCDNYITYARYACVLGDRVSTTQKWLTLAYVIINLYFCWWPFFTILPFFVNLNNGGVETFVVLQAYWNFPAYTLFNIFHTYLLCREIADRFDDGSEVALKIRVQAYRSIVHDGISIVAVACYAFVAPLGTCLQVILIVVALHFVFNWKTPSLVLVGQLKYQTLSQLAPPSAPLDESSNVQSVSIVSDEPPLVCRMINDGFDEADTRSVMPVLPGSEHDGDDVEMQTIKGSVLIRSKSGGGSQLDSSSSSKTGVMSSSKSKRSVQTSSGKSGGGLEGRRDEDDEVCVRISRNPQSHKLPSFKESMVGHDDDDDDDDEDEKDDGEREDMKRRSREMGRERERERERERGTVRGPHSLAEETSTSTSIAACSVQCVVGHDDRPVGLSLVHVEVDGEPVPGVHLEGNDDYDEDDEDDVFVPAVGTL